MSGCPWTPERKAAMAQRMRTRWKDPDYRRDQSRKRAAAMQDPARRAAASARMKRLNARMRDDEELMRKCVRGQKKVRRTPAYRAMQSAVMTDIMARPELRRRARFHCIAINKKPKVRKRQWAGRRRKQAQRAEAMA